MPVTRQTSFAAGELSPTLHGRTDLPQYGAGLRTCRNFFISKHGAAVSRPGMEFIAEAYSVDTDPSYTHRLVPFVYAESRAYVLEFVGGSSGGTPGRIRVLKAGALVSGVAIDTPYVAADVRRLRFAQVGRYLTITHPDYPPHELRWGGTDTDWTFTEIDFSLEELATEPFIIERTTAPTGTEKREWRYMVTIVGKRDGVRFETAPRRIKRLKNASTGTLTTISDFEFVISREDPLTIDLTLGSPPADYSVVEWRIYRGRGLLFGLVGAQTFDATRGGGNWFRDYGEDPDYSQPPPQGVNPFAIYEPAMFEDELVRVEDPVAVGFYEQRQVLAGTSERPGTIWLSAVNDYLNFDFTDEDSRKRLPFLSGNEAIEITLASSRSERIQQVLGRERLIVFTDSSVWAVSSGTGGPITPTDYVARVQSEVGAADNPPLPVAGSLLYVRAKGAGVQDLLYDEGRQGYAGRDLTILSQHILAGRRIMDWAYAEEPWGLVWAVRSDGVLLSLTYDGAAWAWAQHETDGRAEAICTVPENGADAVYLVVRRQIQGAYRWYIERMASRVISSVDEAICLDSATYEENAAPAMGLGGLSHLAGREVMALADGNVVGPLTVDALGTVIFPVAATKMVVGLPYTCEIETLDVAGARTEQKIVKRVVWEVEASRGAWTGSGTGLWAGEDVDHATPWRQRVVADDDRAMELHTGEVDVRISGRWAKHGRAVLQQRDPLPLTVLGVSREIAVGG